MESPESQTIRIEKARPEDVLGMQEVIYRAWLATYPNEVHRITVADIEERFKDRLSPEILEKRRERFANPSEGETTLVARDGEKVIGICRVIVHDDRNEQAAFYLLPEYQRCGIGTRLWKEAQKYV
ncbi:MAG: GNAT family N-acetyltransferase, partial [Minisyncoccia bacterium]